MASLEVQSVWKNFGGVLALQDVSLTLEEGYITALIGPNGSGKTTLINVISGVYRPSQGKVFFGAERIDTLPAHLITSRGIVRTFQVMRIFKEMTAIENVMCGAHNWTRAGVIDSLLPLPWVKREEATISEQAMGFLESVGLRHIASSPAKALAFGHQRLVELARALAAKPKVLLLDEPMSGLNPQERQLMEQKLLDLCQKGVTILLVEHEVKTVIKLARKIVVLNFGGKLAEGSPEEIRNNPQVVEAYLGSGV